MTSEIDLSLGVSYITSSMACSSIERSPLAPVLRSMAFLAALNSASSVNVSLTSSISNKRWYCFVKAFL